MKYLCLIHLDEQEMSAMPAGDMSALNAEHLDFNDGLRTSRQFIVAEALESARTTACVRVREEVAARIPSARLGTVEVRQARQLAVEGRPPRWG